jgi:hypothetical protein
MATTEATDLSVVCLLILRETHASNSSSARNITCGRGMRRNSSPFSPGGVISRFRNLLHVGPRRRGGESGIPMRGMQSSGSGEEERVLGDEAAEETWLTSSVEPRDM